MMTKVENEPGTGPYVAYRREHGLGRITLCRPEALNALNEIVLQQMEKAILEAESDQETAQARLSSADEDPRGPGCAQETTSEGSQAPVGLCGLEVGPAMSPPAGRFGRSERLLHSRDFQRVARSGIRVASPDFVLLVAPARALPVPTSIPM